MLTDYDTFCSFVNKKSIPLDKSSFFNLATESSIDPGFALSIWALETGWGKSKSWREGNNPAGIKATPTEYVAYSTQEEGIKAMFELIESYCDSGLTTVKEVRHYWSESEDTSDIVSIWKEIITK